MIAKLWFKRAVGIKVNKHGFTSFRQGLSRNQGFQTLIMVDSGQKHAGMTVQGKRFINPIDNKLSICGL
jgi:hypothetical protein